MENEKCKFTNTIFWAEKFITEEGGGAVNKAFNLDSPGLFKFLKSAEEQGNEILGLRFAEDSELLEILIRPKKDGNK